MRWRLDAEVGAERLAELLELGDRRVARLAVDAELSLAVVLGAARSASPLATRELDDLRSLRADRPEVAVLPRGRPHGTAARALLDRIGERRQVCVALSLLDDHVAVRERRELDLVAGEAWRLAVTTASQSPARHRANLPRPSRCHPSSGGGARFRRAARRRWGSPRVCAGSSPASRRSCSFSVSCLRRKSPTSSR